MRKLALALVLVLGGCASFTNPITVTRLAAIESGYGIALSAAIAYRDVCNKRVIARTTCTPIVRKMRTYDRQAQAAIVAAQVAVRAGDNLNAVSALVAAQDALSSFQSFQAVNGVR